MSHLLLGEPVLMVGRRSLCLGERRVEPLELGRDLVALLLQPRELLLALGPRLGEGVLQPLDLGGCPLVLVLQAAQVLRVRRLGLGESRLEPLDVGQQPLLLVGMRFVFLEPGERLLVLGLSLGKGRLEPLDVGQQPLLLGSAVPQALELVAGLCLLLLEPGERLLVLGQRLGEGGLEALDLGAQLLQLRGVGLHDERRFRAPLGVFGLFLGLGVHGLLGFVRSGLQLLDTGLDGLGFLDLRDFFRLGLGRKGGQSGRFLDRLRLAGDVCRCIIGGLDAGPRGRRDRGRRQPKPGEVGARPLRVELLVLRRDAEREAVLGPERAAALHRERMRNRGARREAELHDDLAQRALRLLLHLEHGRELLLADQPELGHQLAELTLRHALALGGGAHARVPTRRRVITAFLSAPKASNLNTADPGPKNACSRDGPAGRHGRRLRQDTCGVRTSRVEEEPHVQHHRGERHPPG